ncbi:MAG: hypothetical protein LBU45_00830 [Azoarcus sp.]|nr:hypothetical protein [Azoarcus sp.]
MPFPDQLDFDNEVANDPFFIEFKQRIGYDEAIRQEAQDGLILIDFRRIPQPPFMVDWPYIKSSTGDPWSYRELRLKADLVCYHLSWGAEGSAGGASIEVNVYDNYEDVRRDFFRNAASTSMLRIPFEKCPKEIGTVCVMDSIYPDLKSPPKTRLFFFYKNIFVLIDRASSDAIAEKIGEWMFKVLKAFPRSPMDAPFKPQEPPFPFRIETP